MSIFKNIKNNHKTTTSLDIYGTETITDTNISQYGMIVQYQIQDYRLLSLMNYNYELSDINKFIVQNMIQNPLTGIFISSKYIRYGIDEDSVKLTIGSNNDISIHNGYIYNNTTVIGMIDYINGILIFRSTNLNENFSLYYKYFTTISHYQFMCEVPANQFCKSQNVTFTDNSQLYITKIGIYDDSNNLIMVAQLPHPIAKSKTIDCKYKIDIDICI